MATAAESSQKTAPDNEESGVQKRRQRILAAARAMIERHGVDKLRVRDLADAAGVATATLYNQFGGKDGIVELALKEDYLERFSISGLENQGRSPAAALRQLIAQSASDARDKPENTAAVLKFYFRADSDDALRSVTHEGVKQFFLAILRDVSRRDELVPWAQMAWVADDMVSATYAVLLKWLQGNVSEEELEPRLLAMAALPCVAVSRGKSREEFEQLLADLPPCDATHSA
ncbi:MAG: TetR/AcrR family transcriptional regulator [Halioglobus sp.]|nr:TetR/AcrR family transcriptional regulator [Halioglobus sp.]